MENKLTIAQVKLTKAMENNFITQLSVKLGVTRQTLYDLKNGVYNTEKISIGLARSLKNVLKIDYEDWFEYLE